MIESRLYDINLTKNIINQFILILIDTNSIDYAYYWIKRSIQTFPSLSKNIINIFYSSNKNQYSLNKSRYLRCKANNKEQFKIFCQKIIEKNGCIVSQFPLLSYQQRIIHFSQNNQLTNQFYFAPLNTYRTRFVFCYKSLYYCFIVLVKKQ